MKSDNYKITQYSVSSILNYVENSQIAIPEIQRPFVWKGEEVRALIDSLYEGYPIGYLIVWQNSQVRVRGFGKGGTKKILIDGQQRVTALMAALLGKEVLDEQYQSCRIRIAFNPLAQTGDERFAVCDEKHEQDSKWIPDISIFFRRDFSFRQFEKEYKEANPGEDFTPLEESVDTLKEIVKHQVGVIELSFLLDIDVVSEIFIRINSQGAKLNQADFAMSKIAANTKYGGDILRKAIDYFSHLAMQPDWYSEMTKDKSFMLSPFAPKLKWLKDDREDIFDPDYSDILRIAFMSKFGRAKMKDLVSLLGGRDFETRDYKEEIAEKSFDTLKEGILDFMNEYTFSNFILTIKSAGFIANKLINSQMTLDFAYTLYLLLNSDPHIDKSKIKHYVSKWYVLSTLTSRYIGSPETVMDMDIRRMKERGFEAYFKEIEEADLSETFWSVGLVQNLETSVINSPYFNVYLAAQIYLGDNALFSNGSNVRDLITVIGDVHHIFPKQYLIKNGWKEKSKYNQIANYTYLDTQVNKAISDDAPHVYFSMVLQQCETGNPIYGNITNKETLLRNMEQNSIPENILTPGYDDYDEFLVDRRKLMAKKIKEYYYSL